MIAERMTNGILPLFTRKKNYLVNNGNEDNGEYELLKPNGVNVGKSFGGGKCLATVWKQGSGTGWQREGIRETGHLSPV